MLLGAFLDLGVPIETFHRAWRGISLDNYEAEIFETRKAGMRALRCRVKTDEKQGPRTWKQYEKLIKSSRPYYLILLISHLRIR